MIPDHPFRDYRGRRVTVMGLGSFGGGLGAVRFLVERGAIVTVTDLRAESQLAEAIAELEASPPAHWHLGRHDAADFLDAELLVVNPAIRRDHPLLKLAASRGVPHTSEMNLFWQHQRGRIIAVTGSNGKSTTTAMIHAILDKAAVGNRGLPASTLSPRPRGGGEGTGETGWRVWLGGNIGRSLLPEVDQIQPGDLVVLELSSFQLTDLDRLQVSPWISVVTNFSPNHLDWHDTLAHYRWAKQTLLRWQSSGDVAVLNADDSDVRGWTTPGQRLYFGEHDHHEAGTYLCQAQAMYRDGPIEKPFPLCDWLKLPGRHNVMNALAATTAAIAAGATWNAVQAGLENYTALPHRLEFIAEIDGRRFYNDSLATTPESAIVGLAAFTQPVILLAGGYDKQVDLTEMAQHVAAHAKAVALMGQTGPQLRVLIEQCPASRVIVSGPQPDFAAACRWAWDQSSPGDVILLSPGCASYDWFQNFADRGRQFCEFVQHLASSQ